MEQLSGAILQEPAAARSSNPISFSIRWMKIESGKGMCIRNLSKAKSESRSDLRKAPFAQRAFLAAIHLLGTSAAKGRCPFCGRIGGWLNTQYNALLQDCPQKLTVVVC